MHRRSNAAATSARAAWLDSPRLRPVARERRDETEAVPRCGGEIVRGAVRAAVEEGLLWLTSGPTSLWREPVPEDVLTDAARLQARPERVPASALMDDALPGAWEAGAANGADLTRALSHARGEAMPWGLVRESIAAGVDSRWLEARDDHGDMCCTAPAATPAGSC